MLSMVLLKKAQICSKLFDLKQKTHSTFCLIIYSPSWKLSSGLLNLNSVMFNEGFVFASEKAKSAA